MEKIYLDYAATTPVDKAVKEKIVSFLDVDFGNPSSTHSFGSSARQAIDKARETAASFLNAREREIIFTASATQANNIAILGVLKSAGGGHVITSSIEHKAVIAPLKESGADVSYLKVGENGLVSADEVRELIREDTVLITIGYVNSEVGSVQPIKEIGDVVREINSKRNKKILFHTDAVQAVNYLSCDVDALGVDMLTISGHKMYGPKGAGILFIKDGSAVSSVFYGATQERSMSPGTENVMAIAGLGFAIEELEKQDNSKTEFLQKKIIEEVASKVQGSFLNGGAESRVPNNINFSFVGVEGESLMFALDSEGVAVSTGSACASSSLNPSYVLLAMGATHERAHGSIRVSLGRYTTEEEVDLFLEKLILIVEKLRKISGR